MGDLLSSRRRVVGHLFSMLGQIVLTVALVVLFLELVNKQEFLRKGITWAAPLTLKFLIPVSFLAALIQISWSRLNWQAPFRFGKLPPRLAWVGSPMVVASALILFLFPLLYAWTSLIDPCGAVGGYLPFSDALGYWSGAEVFQMDGQLDAWNCRRPINALLLAVRLALTGNDLRGALLLQALLLGFSCFLLAWTVGKEYGSAVGFLVLSILYSISWEFIPSTQSEALGLTLGTLATTILWSAARDRRPAVVIFGLFFLTLALNARAGAFFVLPALAVWAAWAFRKQNCRLSWPMAGLAVAAIAMGFVVNGALRWYYGIGFGIGHGNFSYTLYGLSTGHPDWTRIYVDHPESMHIEEGNVSFIYARAWENIIHSPYNLILGYSRGMLVFLVGLKNYCLSFIAVPNAYYFILKLWLLAALGWFLWTVRRGMAGKLALGAALLFLIFRHHIASTQSLIQMSVLVGIGLSSILYLWNQRRDPRVGFLLTGILGFVLSGPIIYPDGGPRVLVVSYPLIFLLIALFPVAWARKTDTDELITPRLGTGAWAPVVTSALLFLVVLVGPAFAHRREQSHPRVPLAQQNDAGTWIVRTGPGTPRLDIQPQQKLRASFVPRLGEADFLSYLSRSAIHFYCPTTCSQFRGSMTIFLGVLENAPAWFVGPREMIDRRTQLQQLHGKMVVEGGQKFIFVSDRRPLDTRIQLSQQSK